ncbi:MAG: flippase-like domain-containing protein, partial [Elusimicrobiota bacterium]|nr:flippase-like domain-containing protein [Elusimicrobiota bacterium]
MLKKHFFKILLGCLISAFLIYLAFKDIDFPSFFSALADTKYHILIFAVICICLTYITRSLRYYFIILPIKKTRVFENFPYLVLGFFMNNVVPLRLGELVRAKITGERLGISRSAALATVVVERLLDIVAYVIFFFLIANVLPFPKIVKGSFIFCAVLFGLMLAVLFLISVHDKKSVVILSKLPLPKKIKDFALSLIHKFIAGLLILKSKKDFLLAFLLSFLVWTFESTALLIVAWACGISLSLVDGIFVVIIIGISGIIPTAPGYIGAFELAGITSLGVLGVGENSAVACILIFHVLSIFTNFSLAAFSIIKEKISFSDLFKFEEIGE